jgi:hypothetical protein
MKKKKQIIEKEQERLKQRIEKMKSTSEDANGGNDDNATDELTNNTQEEEIEERTRVNLDQDSEPEEEEDEEQLVPKFAQKTNFTQSDLHTTYLYVLNTEFKIRAIEVVFNLFALIFPVLIHSPHHRRRTLDRKKNSYQGLRNFVVEKKTKKNHTQTPNTPKNPTHPTLHRTTHPHTQTPKHPIHPQYQTRTVSASR